MLIRAKIASPTASNKDNIYYNIDLLTSGIKICVISNNVQMLDHSQLTSLRIDIYNHKFITIKSAHHFHTHLRPLASRIETRWKWLGLNYFEWWKIFKYTSTNMVSR